MKVIVEIRGTILRPRSQMLESAAAQSFSLRREFNWPAPLVPGEHFVLEAGRRGSPDWAVKTNEVYRFPDGSQLVRINTDLGEMDHVSLLSEGWS